MIKFLLFVTIITLLWGDTMLDVLYDTLLDGLKLLPFLFIAFLIIEYIEHKLSSKNEKRLEKAGHFGPLIGSLLGAIPQCGLSVLATNLYITRIITLGTLISIYLSTSDEMLPILISHQVAFTEILKILALKVIIGMLYGFIIDFILRKKNTPKKDIKHFCEENHCDCEHGIVKSSLKHTFNIWFFILLITLILNTCMHFGGEKLLSNIFLNDSFLSPFIASLVGLIPNCAASVVLTELYINNILSLGAALSGLLTGSGVAILVLFKENHNLKENLKIVGLIYFLGVISGLIIKFLTMIF